MKDWDESYRNIGIIQSKVCSIVEESVAYIDKTNARVLDLCYGTGRHALFLAKKGYEVYGLDISKEAKRITGERAKEAGVTMNLAVGDMHELPYEDGYFDAVIAVHCLPHSTLTGLKKCISELDRVTKPGSIITLSLLSTDDERCGQGNEIEHNTFVNPNDPNEADVPHHYSDEKEVDELVSGFKLVKKEYHKAWSKRRNAQSVHWYIVMQKNINSN